VVYGRQLPYPDASVAARFARLFNYPDTPRRTVAADIATRGLKALFCSNSCAAYRARALTQVGGFPEDLPLGEDLAVTGRLLEAGFASVYAPGARVVHSHNYGIAEEFTRYFDIGALLAVDPWLCARRLRSGGEGMRFVTAEMRYTLKNGSFADLLSIVPRTAAKLFGFKLGHRCRSLPPALIRRVSMHHYYWTGGRA
ncbi:MAG TPA: glycosyltransferase, partial [Alphaproteobacteria bacterium]|nr:glycosyltransferase [Alphaproteobacteria bacterium]